MMKKNLATACVIFGAFVGWAGGCGESEPDPVTASTMALTAQSNVERALRGLHTAGSFLADSSTLAQVLSVPAGQTCTQTQPVPCSSTTGCQPTTEPTCVDDRVTVADLQDGRQEISDAIDDLIKKLRDELFIPANLESEDGQRAVYRVPPSFLCAGSGDTSATPTSDPAPTPQASLDPECVEDVERVQPRLRLVPTGADAVDITLLMTASQREPVMFSLAPDKAGVTLDLGELKATLDAAGEDSGDLDSMTGKFAIELKRLADRDYSIRLNLATDVGITTKDSLAQLIVATLGARSPSVEIRLDGNAQKVTGTLDLGQFSLRGPLNAFREIFEDSPPSELGAPPAPTKTYTGAIELLVAGLTGSVSFDGNKDRVDLRGLGLGNGSSTLKHDGALLSKLDINPSAGRRFDLSVERGADGKTVLGFAPVFDLTWLTSFASLSNQISDIPALLLGDTMTARFEGASPSLSVEPDLDQVRVLSGTLSLTSASVPAANLQAAAGMCLRESPATDSLAHEILSAFAVSACQ